jgi:hypothetical protein
MKKFVLINGLSLVMLGIISSYGSKKVVAQNSTREILPLQLEEQIPVPSVAGRIDHFSADAKRKRLFVSALGNNSLEVIDVFAGRVVHSIKGLAQPQGPLYVPAVDKLYVANAEDGKVPCMTERRTRFARPLILAKIPTTCVTTRLPSECMSDLGKTMAASP